jgi:hypothetical protein
MQGGQSCSQQVAVLLFFTCSSVWSAPLPARWGSLVLNGVLWPRDKLRNQPPALLWDVSFLLHSLSQPLCLSGSLLSAGGYSRWLACQPMPTLCLSTLWYITEISLPHPRQFSSERSALCPTPVFQCGFRVPSPPLLLVIDFSS